ncbi:2'-5' RNA ligase family protein [Pseudomonas stutzeri]|nr:2'-5' RNA ligase family protein [Stutzerimonas stutzeri]
MPCWRRWPEAVPFPEAHSLPCEWRDYPEWHRGRNRYAVWTLPVDCPQILARLERARAHLGAWLHGAGRRQAHVSLFVCGFPSAAPHFDDDFPAARLDAQLDALRRLAAGPFELHIGGLRSFASAPFLAVADPHERLAGLRAALAACGPEIRQAPYRAHLTVGLYARAIPRAQLARQLAAFAEREPLRLPVRELHLSSYAATDLSGPLRCERRLRLD